MSHPKPQIWSLTFKAPLSHMEKYALALEEMDASLAWPIEDEQAPLIEGQAFIPIQNPLSLTEIKNQVIALFSRYQLDPHEVCLEEVPDKNWLLENQKQFPPLEIGSFFIYNPIHKTNIPAHKIGLEMNAAVAFGSGEHATTHGCLVALEQLHHLGIEPAPILDMGCGSGILGIAALKLWPSAHVWACDFDAFATQTTHENAVRNHVLSSMTIILGDGFEKIQSTSFDLILANILANPLIAMAPSMATHTHPGSHVILSGLLESQSADVLKSYVKEGFKCRSHFGIQGWSTLLLEKL